MTFPGYQESCRNLFQRRTIKAIKSCQPSPFSLTNDIIISEFIITVYLQQLTNDFRLQYSQFWLSILKADIDGIKKAADLLGVGQLHGLFACMVTGRSWGSIQKGIDKAEKNSAEVRKLF
jgi:hypothetical protein